MSHTPVIVGLVVVGGALALLGKRPPKGPRPGVAPVVENAGGDASVNTADGPRDVVQTDTGPIVVAPVAAPPKPVAAAVQTAPVPKPPVNPLVQQAANDVMAGVAGIWSGGSGTSGGGYTSGAKAPYSGAVGSATLGSGTRYPGTTPRQLREASESVGKLVGAVW